MKKRKIYKKTLLFIATLLSCPFIYCREQSDSLAVYMEMAVRSNPTVLQRLNEYQAALQKVPQAGSLSDPELNVGIFLSPMELLGGNQVADIQLMQMFPWFGVLRNAKDEMSLMAKAKYESFRDAKIQVLYDVQRTWYELNQIQQTIRLTEKNVEILKTIERLTTIKFRTGFAGVSSTMSSGINRAVTSGNTSGQSGMQSMGGGSTSSEDLSLKKPVTVTPASSMGSSSGGSGLADLYRIQIEMGDLENSIALFKNQKTTLVARFNSYLNRPVHLSVSQPDELTPDTLGIELSALSDSMLSNNPMLGMLKYEQQSLDARGKMVRQMGYPMIGVGLDYSLINKSEMSNSSMNGKDMIMPMLKVTIPIYRKKYKAMRAETNLMKSASEQGYQAATYNLQTEYFEALQLYQDAGRRMKLYENQSQLAGKSLDIMIKTFSTSGAGLTDILQVRQQLLDFELKKMEAIIDNNTAIARLKRLMATSQIK